MKAQREIRRVFELWIGAQRSGKTFALMARVKALSLSRDVSSVFVLDVTGEWSSFSGRDVAHVSTWAGYLSETRDDLPLVIIFDDAATWVTWPSLLDEAQAQGKVALVMDEVYKWLPPGGPLEEPAERAVLAGRHLPALDRRLYPLHIIAACQYPRSVHHLLREQAATIIVGTIHGELAEGWIRGEAGKETWERVSSLGEHEFTIIKGDRKNGQFVRPDAKGVRWR